MSDYILTPATTGVASSADYDENLTDVEDTLLDGLGVGIISGAIPSVTAGLNISLTAAEILVGIRVNKILATFLLTDNATNVCWCVADPDNAEKASYEIRTDGTTPSRAAKVFQAIAAGGVVTSLVYDLTIGRYDLPTGAVTAAAAEVKTARGSLSTLGARLDVGLSSVDGKLGSGMSYLSKSVAGAAGTTVLTATEYANRTLKFTGALTGNRVIQVPITSGKRWTIINSTTGAFTLQVIGSTGTGIIVPQNETRDLVADGTNIIDVSQYIPAFGELYDNGGTLTATTSATDYAWGSSNFTNDANCQQGITIAGNGFTIVSAGVYRIVASGSFLESVAAATLTMRVKVNGTEVVKCRRTLVGDTSVPKNIDLNNLLSLNAGDTVILYFSSSANSNNITFQNLSLTLQRVG